MVKLCIKLYSSSTASADNIASAICPVSGQIVLCQWALVAAVAGAVGSNIVYQLSTQSTRQAALNDCRNIIDECAIGSAAGAGFAAAENRVTPIAGIKIAAGDKLYLHLTTLIAFTTSQVNLNIQIA